MFAASKTKQVSSAANYIEDVFSTYLYTGNGSTNTISNNIDLSTKGGLVWLKTRNQANNNFLTDTARGTNSQLVSDSTIAAATLTDIVTAFNTTGFTTGPSSFINSNGESEVSWTFRKQPKFFDIVTYTGTGSATTVAHNLGSVPGCIMVKRTDAAGEWRVWHRGLSNSATNSIFLNRTDAETGTTTIWNSTDPTSTVFSLGNSSATNGTGATYVAYIFAHDAGGFGLTGTDNVISCGSFTPSSGNATVNLGYEPQWILIKNTAASDNWQVIDNMRGWSMTDYSRLFPNSSSAESTATNYYVFPSATGFNITNFADQRYIYIAIRRGPMKVPTDATKVFYPQAVPQGATIDSSGVPFPPDLVNTFSRNGTSRGSGYLQFQFADRLRSLGTPNDTLSGSGCPALISSSTAAEVTTSTYIQLKADGRNITRSNGWNSVLYGDWIYYFMQRAPNFFDVVCYTGTGSATTFNHNLGVVPEMMIVKERDTTGAWRVYVASLGNTNHLVLNTNGQVNTGDMWNSTTPTSTVFSVGTSFSVNRPGGTFVNYLFASCPGISKVGSYTGNGTTQTINCGFPSGVRFVLIKQTDAAGDWYVYDTARGMTTLVDPYLLMNSTAAESATLGSVTTVSTGFAVNASILAAINTNTATYIYLAIA